MAAFLLDVAVLFIPTVLIQAGIHNASSNPGSTSTASSAVSILAGTLVSSLYFGILNGIGRGQTLGNMALGIGVRDARTGAVVGIARSTLRWVVRYLLYFFLVPGILNDLWPLWDAMNQTLADKAATTVMIKLR